MMTSRTASASCRGNRPTASLSRSSWRASSSWSTASSGNSTGSSDNSSIYTRRFFLRYSNVACRTASNRYPLRLPCTRS